MTESVFNQADRLLGLQIGKWLHEAAFHPASLVLDVGCSSGRFTQILARQLDKGKVTALEAAPDEDTRKSIDDMVRLFGNVTFRESTVSDGDLEEGTFDYVFLACPEYASQITDDEWRRIGRLVRPGGRVVHMFRSEHAESEAERVHEEASRLSFALVGQEPVWGPRARRRAAELGFRTVAHERFRRKVRVPAAAVLTFLRRWVDRHGTPDALRGPLEDLFARGERHGMELGFYEVAVLEPAGRTLSAERRA